jgi:hypothetical protein
MIRNCTRLTKVIKGQGRHGDPQAKSCCGHHLQDPASMLALTVVCWDRVAKTEIISITMFSRPGSGAPLATVLSVVRWLRVFC